MNTNHHFRHSKLIRFIHFAMLAAILPILVPCWGDEAGQARPAKSDAELRSWLKSMHWHHGYSMAEMSQVTGLGESKLTQKLHDFGIRNNNRPPRPDGRMFVLPYPGGRHPRIGFLDGAINPQRESKLSVFAPWDDTSYAVLDVPEAIWSNLGLTYLAHTHIDTVWSKQDIELPQLEWVVDNGNFVLERRLPNGIVFGVKVIPRKDQLRMKMWLTNGTDETLTDLRVQNCVMLKGMRGFEQQTNDNKKFADNYAVAHSSDQQRWIISAWDPPHRNWGNTQCPCLHSDPKFADCPPGETRWLRGWFSFYEGESITKELARIEATNWRSHPLHHVTGNVTGKIKDANTGKAIPARLTVQNTVSNEWHYAKSTAVAGSAEAFKAEHFTALSADPFQLHLSPGTYRLHAAGAEPSAYESSEFQVEVKEDDDARQQVTLALTPSKSTPDGDFHIFLLAGQSNMAGRGKVAEKDRQPIDRVLSLNKKGEWVPAIDPLHFDKPGIVGVGLGRTFAKAYADAHPGVTVGLVPCAVGGSPISSWTPGGYHKQTKLHPYDDCLKRMEVAQKSGDLKGILWHQGESDSNERSSDNYERRLHELIERFRKEFNAPSVPFVAGQMGQFKERPWDEHRRKVDGVHQSLPQKVDGTAFASSDGLKHKGDKVHFDAASYRELGKRYFSAFQQLVGKMP